MAKAVGGATPSTTVYVSKTAGLPNSPYAGQELAEYGLSVSGTNPARKDGYGGHIDDVPLDINSMNRVAMAILDAAAVDVFTT